MKIWVGLFFGVFLLLPTLGSAAGIYLTTNEALWSWESDHPWSHLADALNPAGDVNCDGYDDLVLGSRSWDATGVQGVDTGRAWLFYGSENGPAATPDVIFTPPTSDTQGWFAQEAIGVGDVNHDNCDDLLISMVNYDEAFGNEGGIFIYYGAPMPGGIDTTHDRYARGNGSTTSLGWGAPGWATLECRLDGERCEYLLVVWSSCRHRRGC